MVPEPMSYVHFKESTRQGHLSVCPMTLNCDLYDTVDISFDMIMFQILHMEKIFVLVFFCHL